MAVPLLAAAVMLTGLLAGFWCTWGVVVLPALDRVPPPAAVASMRVLNEVVLSPTFLVTFALAPVLTAAAAVALAVEGSRPSAVLAALALLLQVVGVVAVTRGVNVPLNEQLASSTADPAGAWAAFSGPWQHAHAVRTVSGGLAFVATVAAWWTR